MKNSNSLKVGDAVVVKKDVLDPDSGKPIEGWQGRIEEFEKPESDENNVLIALDSITLQSLPISYFENCEEEGFDWRTYYLAIEDIELAKARDTKKDVENIIDEIEKQVAWCGLGEEGKRIKQVLTGIDLDDEEAALEAWEEYLQENLKFPLEAEVSEYQERGLLKVNDKVTILSISDVDEMYGVIVKIKYKGRKYDFPLCDLEATGSNTAIKQIISDYSCWFTNK